MKLFIKLLMIPFLLLGLSMFIRPDLFFAWVEGNLDNTWLYVLAIGIRLFLGLLLVVAAKESKFPKAIKYFGLFILAAALLLLLMGQDNFREMATTLIAYFKPFAAVAGLIAMLIGSFLLYAFWNGNDRPDIDMEIV